MVKLGVEFYGVLSPQKTKPQKQNKQKNPTKKQKGTEKSKKNTVFDFQAINLSMQCVNVEEQIF